MATDPAPIDPRTSGDPAAVLRPGESPLRDRLDRIDNVGKLRAGEIRVPVLVYPGQFSDGPHAHRRDVRKVIALAKDLDAWWIHGTEAGPETTLRGEVVEQMRAAGYRLSFFRSSYVAVDRRVIVPGSWRAGSEFSVDNDRTVGPGHDLGVAWGAWRNEQLGRMAALSSHAATKGDPSRPPGWNVDENREHAATIGELVERFGKGSGLVWEGGDRNIRDDRTDVYLGQADLVTAGDELGKHPNTGHGPIDVSSSYRRDSRVRAISWRSLGDDRFPLASDHYVSIAEYGVRPLEPRRPIRDNPQA